MGMSPWPEFKNKMAASAVDGREPPSLVRNLETRWRGPWIGKQDGVVRLGLSEVFYQGVETPGPPPPTCRRGDGSRIQKQNGGGSRWRVRAPSLVRNLETMDWPIVEVWVVLGFRLFPRYFVRTENLQDPLCHSPPNSSFIVVVGIEKCRWMLCTPGLMSCGAPWGMVRRARKWPMCRPGFLRSRSWTRVAASSAQRCLSS